MQCDQCGADRPRSGRCPECGAPAPGTFSSLSQWKGRSGPGDSNRGNRRPGSGDSWRGSSAGSRRGRSGDRWGETDEDAWSDYQDDTYDAPRAGGSSNRNRRRGNDYDEVELGRALVPTRDELMPMQTGAGLPALPGMPATEEEERALGIRRPAYIPATSGKRKRKLSSFRVVSGVLSVILVCIAGCALAGLLGRSTIERVFGPPVKLAQTPQAYSFKNVPVTPVATKGPAGQYIRAAVTAKNQDRSYNPVDVTSHFTVGSDVYLIVQVRGLTDKKEHRLCAVWYYGSINLGLPEGTQTCTTADSDKNVYFKLERIPQPGEYKVEVYWDRPQNDDRSKDNPNNPSLALTIYFGVEPAAVTPGATNGNGTPRPTQAPTKTPTKK